MTIEKLSVYSKEVFVFLRNLFVVFVLLTLFFRPDMIRDKLNRLGVTRGTVAGMEFETGLNATDAALKETRMSNSALRAELDSSNNLLLRTRAHISDPDLKRAIDTANVVIAGLLAASRKSEGAVTQTIRKNAQLVTEAQANVNGGGQWGVVFGADALLKDALYEQNTVAPKIKLKQVKIFLRDGYYRSVAIAESRAEAEEMLVKAKQRRPDAYIVTMSTWCTVAGETDGYYRCD